MAAIGEVPERQGIDPFVCPRGHHSLEIFAHRFRCKSCARAGATPASWPKDDLVDLRDEQPPLADIEDDRSELDRLRAEMRGEQR